ncbi:acid protease [Imleria badia]|nr:acid protease [Imleria badia]
MLLLPFFILWLTTDSLSIPLHKSHGPRRSMSLPNFDRQAALSAQAATRRKFQNAPAILAGLGTSPAYAIPASLQNTYNRASDFATNITLLTSLPKSSSPQPFYSSSAVRVAAALGSLANPNDTTVVPLQDETDGVDDFEYYGPMSFGSQGQTLQIDCDTGSADLWVPVNCNNNCGTIESFQASASSTFRNTTQAFGVVYGSGSVAGTLAEDTVAIGPFKVYNQSFGAVQSVSENFANSPNDGLAGMAFGTIANSHKPTFFENLIPQLRAPLFSVYLTRNQVRGSEIYLGGIDVSKASGDTITWVPVVSKTYWTLNMTAALVNNTPVDTGPNYAIADTGTSFIYVPTHVASAIYQTIPGSKPARDANGNANGFYVFPCVTQIVVSFVFGPHTLAVDPRDMNLGRSPTDSSECIAAIVDAGRNFKFAILGDAFLKSYVSIFDYSHGARVGFLKSINE